MFALEQNLMNGLPRHNFDIPPPNQVIQAATMFLEVRHKFFFDLDRQKNPLLVCSFS